MSGCSLLILALQVELQAERPSRAAAQCVFALPVELQPILVLWVELQAERPSRAAAQCVFAPQVELQPILVLWVELQAEQSPRAMAQSDDCALRTDLDRLLNAAVSAPHHSRSAG